MKLETVIVSPLQVNCYVITEGDHVIVIDPGDNVDKISKAIRVNNPKVTILLTHAHIDHMSGALDLSEKYGCKIFVHKKDQALVQIFDMQAEMVQMNYAMGKMPSPSDLPLSLTFGDLTIAVIHTPGHSPGGVCYYIEKEKMLFTGDTLFAQSIGRSDLWGGSHETLLQSIQTKILSLDPAITVYPGHGETTSIGDEAAMNPFLIGRRP